MPWHGRSQLVKNAKAAHLAVSTAAWKTSAQIIIARQFPDLLEVNTTFNEVEQKVKDLKHAGIKMYLCPFT